MPNSAGRTIGLDLHQDTSYVTELSCLEGTANQYEISTLRPEDQVALESTRGSRYFVKTLDASRNRSGGQPDENAAALGEDGQERPQRLVQPGLPSRHRGAAHHLGSPTMRPNRTARLSAIAWACSRKRPDPDQRPPASGRDASARPDRTPPFPPSSRHRERPCLELRRPSPGFWPFERWPSQ